MTIVKLRTEVADERGRLGALASAIAAYGGNILGIDVHLLDGERVADEFVIEFPDGHAGDALGIALRRAGGGHMQMERLDEHVVVDPVVRAIDIACQVFGPEPLETRLEFGVAQLVAADHVRLVGERDAPDSDLVRRAAREAAPVVGRERILGTPAADGDEPPWVLVVPDVQASRPRWIIVERRAPAFSSSETARVSALLRLVHAATAQARPIEGLVRDPRGPRPLLSRRPATFFRPRTAASPSMAFPQ